MRNTQSGLHWVVFNMIAKPEITSGISWTKLIGQSGAADGDINPHTGWKRVHFGMNQKSSMSSSTLGYNLGASEMREDIDVMEVCMVILAGV
jgi:hypothetical protein